MKRNIDGNKVNLEYGYSLQAKMEILEQKIKVMYDTLMFKEVEYTPSSGLKNATLKGYYNSEWLILNGKVSPTRDIAEDSDTVTLTPNVGANVLRLASALTPYTFTNWFDEQIGVHLERDGRIVLRARGGIWRSGSVADINVVIRLSDVARNLNE